MEMPTPQVDAPDQAVPSGEPSQESGSLMICVERKPDGSFEVYKDEPDAMPAAAAMESDASEAAEPTPPERQQCDTLEDALKAVIKIERQNPMDQSYGSQMSAGFQGEHRTPY